jgi:hypothetical protein
MPNEPKNSTQAKEARERMRKKVTRTISQNSQFKAIDDVSKVLEGVNRAIKRRKK